MAIQNEKKQEKISFFKKLNYSITKFEKYPEMAAEGISSAFRYLAVIMIIFSVIVSIGVVIEFKNTVKDITNYIKNELPNVNLIDGKLNVESADTIKINSNTSSIDQIIINTNTNANTDDMVN